MQKKNDVIKAFDFTKILFFDIETAGIAAHFDDLSEEFQALWMLKARQLAGKSGESLTSENLAQLFNDKAAIYSEFGRVVCISAGFAYPDRESQALRVRIKSFCQESEPELLVSFCSMLEKHFGNPSTHALCGHNIREFDIPYLCRRLLIHGLPLPETLRIGGKRNWEVGHLLDTMDMWKFGDYKNYTSLRLLAAVLGIPSPKDDLDGSQVGRVFWEEKDSQRIARYCEKDVLAAMQVYRRLIGESVFPAEQID